MGQDYLDMLIAVGYGPQIAKTKQNKNKDYQNYLEQNFELWAPDGRLIHLILIT